MKSSAIKLQFSELENMLERKDAIEDRVSVDGVDPFVDLRADKRRTLNSLTFPITVTNCSWV